MSWNRRNKNTVFESWTAEHRRQSKREFVSNFYCVLNWLTMLGASGDAASPSATQEFHKILWNPKVHHRVHKSQPSVSIRRQWIQTIPPHPIPLRSVLILSSHLCLGLSRSCPAHLILLDLICVVTFSLIWIFSHYDPSAPTKCIYNLKSDKNWRTNKNWGDDMFWLSEKHLPVAYFNWISTLMFSHAC
jgi:hypothetical protein